MRPVPDASTVRDFLAHTITVLHEATGAFAKIASSNNPPEHDAIAIVIFVHGHLSGLTWTFPVELARDVARRMVPADIAGTPELDEALCEAAAGELANILTGRGARVLEAHGVAIEMTPPQRVAGAGPGMVARLQTSRGVVEVVFHHLDAEMP